MGSNCQFVLSIYSSSFRKFFILRTCSSTEIKNEFRDHPYKDTEVKIMMHNIHTVLWESFNGFVRCRTSSYLCARQNHCNFYPDYCSYPQQGHSYNFNLFCWGQNTSSYLLTRHLQKETKLYQPNNQIFKMLTI